jgi:hypothetical protein
MGGSSPVRRRWRDLEWIEQFSYVVLGGFITVALVLAACSTFVIDDEPPTLPALPTTTLTTPQRAPANLEVPDTAGDPARPAQGP